MEDEDNERQPQHQQRVTSNIKNGITSSSMHYNPKKPKWWNRLTSNGRGATKAQKRCMKRVLDGNYDATTDDDVVVGGGGDTTYINTDESEHHQNNDTNINNNKNTNNTMSMNMKGLRLPIVPYGSKLKWDDVFSSSSSSSNVRDSSRDIWLELGFGRGENLLALLDTKLLLPSSSSTSSSSSSFHDCNNTNSSKNNKNGNRHNFYLIGAEISGTGIGCLCTKLDQRMECLRKQQNLQKEEEEEDDEHNTTIDDQDRGYVLYDPDLHPDHNNNSQNQTTTDENNVLFSDKNRSNDFDGNPQCVTMKDESPLSIMHNRLRVHAGDGYKLLPKIPDSSLSVILITFPDPFENENDKQYRLVQEQTLMECHRVLRKPTNNININNNSTNTKDDDGGKLFLATDHDGYNTWCHQIINEVNHPQQLQQQQYSDHKNGGTTSSIASANEEEEEKDTNRSPQQLFRSVQPCPNREYWLPAISTYEQKGWNEHRSTKLSCWRVQ